MQSIFHSVYCETDLLFYFSAESAAVLTGV